jgi:DNA protecting protein DprA
MQSKHQLNPFWSAALELSGRVDFSPLRRYPEAPSPLSCLALEQDLPPKISARLVGGTTTHSRWPYLTIADAPYPEALALVPYAPPVLFYRGSLDILQGRRVSVVGSRKCTQRGKRLAASLARTLSRGEIATVSGLAYGIDEAVHWASLHRTAGVLAQGLESRMTLRQERLCNAITDAGGLLVSEFPPNRPPRKWSFLQRNRIIASISTAVVVVEAGRRSGALNTARHALEAGRDVYAVPWSPYDEQGQGCLDLIGNGASLLRTPEHLLSSLGWEQPPADLMDALEKPRKVAELVELTGQSETEVIRQLAGMLLEGSVVQTSDSRYRQR